MALDESTIVRAALDLLRTDGLDGVTVRRLGDRLGVKAPAIYWRFPGKRELLEAMAEEILRARLGELAPYDGRGPWRDWLTDLLLRLREALLAYPDGARIVTGARPLATPTLGRVSEYALRALADVGLDLTTAGTIVYTALHFTFGHLIEEQSSPVPQELDPATLATFAERHPTVARLVATGYDRVDVYRAGLALILREPESGQR
ncbi:TetR family transcriptional regulator [Micromonospora auratinigra]|uniref:Transcriptional regulator, TetR family n=1 Tax=Micromonospora auratinigra TaxID=261654 RepID=A0A1A9A4Z4_9ACTN|nr:TetR family transcriptional regulator [Micromonospora auratinigra]SBT51526.1 transcriptional regulator, TetR family [Micromonospora auratinigra]